MEKQNTKKRYFLYFPRYILEVANASIIEYFRYFLGYDEEIQEGYMIEDLEYGSIELSSINWNNWNIAVKTLKNFYSVEGMPKTKWKGYIKTDRGDIKYKLSYKIKKDRYKDDTPNYVYKISHEIYLEDYEEELQIYRKFINNNIEDKSDSDSCHDKDCM